ncbi:hypothetical protein [Streptomyces sp. NPDC060194]|uniref:hypothetical protein n=1 Tax=Streptomyces sp. NPDC060194 TaxID=3347069 RepID=UPI003666B03D
MMTLVVVSDDAHAHWVRDRVHVNPELRVIWHGADARAALPVAQVLLPDVVVLDLAVVDDAGALAFLRASAPGTCVVLYAPPGRDLPSAAGPLVRRARRGDAASLLRALRAA